MFSRVGWISLKVLEGETELIWVKVHSFADLQVGEDLLHLMEWVVVDLLTLVLLDVLFNSIINRKQLVSESRYVEELLHDRVHVADATQVAESDELLVAVGLAGGLVIPFSAPLELRR